MITCELVGRLGNQAFQLAAALSHALKYGYEFRPPAKTASHIFPLYFRPNGFKFFNPKTFIQNYNEQGHEYNEIPKRDNIRLVGYFQSEKYFKEHTAEVMQMLDLELDQWSPGHISIHIRRGDYLKFSDKHPAVSMDYINSAMDQFRNTERIFIVFSDDIEWCMQNVKPLYPGHTICFSVLKDAHMALRKMAECEHNIIANSTFSWWAAYANPNPNKIIIAPRQWFGPGNGHLNDKDIIPSNWIKL